MSEFYTQQKNKKTFQDIFFEHLNRILTITQFEFTGGYQKQVMVGNNVTTEYVSDKKEEYCQAVEHLAYLAFAYFDEKMKEIYQTYIDNLDTAFKLHYDTKTLLEKSREDYQIYSRKRLKLTSELFKQVCTFAKRSTNYFSISESGETDGGEEIDHD